MDVGARSISAGQGSDRERVPEVVESGRKRSIGADTVWALRMRARAMSTGSQAGGSDVH